MTDNGNWPAVSAPAQCACCLHLCKDKEFAPDEQSLGAHQQLLGELQHDLGDAAAPTLHHHKDERNPAGARRVRIWPSVHVIAAQVAFRVGLQAGSTHTALCRLSMASSFAYRLPS